MSDYNMQSLGDALDAYLEQHGLKEKAAVQSMIREWPRIMGKPIAENTEKMWFKDGVLNIKVSHPIWKQELSLARSKVMELLNKEVGEELIKEVRIY